MKKIIIFMIIMITVFGLTGCGGSSSSEDGSVSATKTDPYIGGTRGVAIQFEDGYPPEEVYDNGQFPFDIDVKLENVGEYEIPKDKVIVKISGIKPEDFGVTETDLIRNGVDDILIPTRKDAEGNLLEGVPSHVIFSDLNFMSSLDGNFNPPIRADVCYEYMTRSISDICIRENVLVPDKDSICKVNEDKNVFNSGAPVQITDFKEVARGSDKVGFSFSVKHKGTGKVYGGDTANCNTVQADKNRVWVWVNTGISGLTCTGLDVDGDSVAGAVSLYNGERTVTCTQDIDSNLAFENRVEMRVTYNYKEDASTNILVKYSGDQN